MDNIYDETPLPDGGLSFSHSGRSLYARCPRLFWYEYLSGAPGVEEYRPELEIGAAFASAIEHWDIGAVDSHFIGVIQDLPAYLSDQASADHAIARWAFSEYSQHFRPYSYNEVPFGAYQIYENLYDRGRFDGIDIADDGTVTIYENKLRGSFSSAMMEYVMRKDPQVTSYILNAMRKFDVPLEKVNVEYRVTIRPGYRKGKRESYKDLRDRIIRDSQSGAKKINTAVIQPTRSLADLNRHEGTVRAMARTANIYAEENFRGNTHSCFTYGKTCKYIDTCKG